MFTGIIQTVGTLMALTPKGGDVQLNVGAGKLDMTRVALGDSIAVNGVCLTVTASNQSSFTVDCSRETLKLTTLGQLHPGSPVNLEPALTLSTPLGGHLVSGHVDGLAIIESRSEEARATSFWLRAPDALAKYIAKKGSVTIDGVSLTVNEVEGARFKLTIIPHTLAQTIMGRYQPGSAVNLEIDVVARYLERLLAGQSQATPQPYAQALGSPYSSD
ncbi:MAG: riboflavin synthase [Halothiobacillus sp. 24-54-40]|jgi:riboflavin synthase|nr:MAG: riboflavin synthase [Halothiobacillus sp. 20-53-49]OYY33102.1 MAG: riboflavin synthase [Halothiobacillus sp. 35-54-62]OYY51540.1 MAG: riboflavin synthase [Halothiobacillus sp. 28-55-5]OYZ88303.1 MAG: riboflavin synthase [Halothiobacillus sp. 24-54-40]OZA79356.1 MAG: riboflavin synthase [Halothiobacillus sp. 39-53-45]HQS01976.1 riboflavin synthase [Halothiobacillus sp.]